MGSIFGEIDSEVTADGTSVLTMAGAHQTHCEFYRARVFQSGQELQISLQHPERFLGAPPANAARSGRMNALGQPAFYGATHEQIALAEVRPPVGSWVVVAQFAVVRPLQLLNLGLLSKVHLPSCASQFHNESKAAFQRHAFLRELSRRMVRPVLPESQDHNYLITQVVADYLALHPKASIDGIIYPSIQRRAGYEDAGGENIVLFHKAATTMLAAQNANTADVDLYGDEDHEYDNDPRYDDASHSTPPLRPTIFYNGSQAATTSVLRVSNFKPIPGLKLIRNSITIHRIEAVDIKTERINVDVVQD